MNKPIKVKLYDIRSITLLFIYEIVCFLIGFIYAILEKSVLNIASLIFGGITLLGFFSQIALYLYGYNKSLLFYEDKIELHWKNTKKIYNWSSVYSLEYYSFLDIIAIKNFTMDMWITEDGISKSFEKMYSVIPMTYKKYLKIIEIRDRNL